MTYLQNVSRRLFIVFIDEESEETGHSECVDFFQRALEIQSIYIPVNCPSAKLLVNEVEQRLRSECFSYLVGVETGSVEVLGLHLRFTETLIQRRLCTTCGQS